MSAAAAAAAAPPRSVSGMKRSGEGEDPPSKRSTPAAAPPPVSRANAAAAAMEVEANPGTLEDVTEGLKTAASEVVRRVSSRLQQNRETMENLKKMQAELEAKKKAAEEAAAKAAAAAAAAAGDPVQRTVQQIVKQWEEDERKTKYLAASGSLLSVLMEFSEGGDTKPSVTFGDLFPKEGATLTPICNIIYGEVLTELIQKSLPSGDMRKFFEVTKPPIQCGTVLRDLPGPIQTHCWICGTDLSKYQVVDCEHRLNVMLALIFTGLYDPVLHGILYRSGRAKEYLDLLRHEYAWSHVRCNRLKRELPVLDASVVGDGSDKKVQVRPHAKISEMLTIIGNCTKGKGYTEPPRCEDLLEKVKREELWSGNFTDETLGPHKTGQTIQGREPAIRASLAPLIAKLNAVKMSPKQLCARVTRTFLMRAIELVPDLTAKTIYATLPPDLQALLPASGGRRRRTYRSRRSSRRVQRGGTKPTDLTKLGRLIEYVVNCVELTHLSVELVTYKPDDGLEDPLVILTTIDDLVSAHADRTAATSTEIFTELLPILDTFDKGSLIDFILLRATVRAWGALLVLPREEEGAAANTMSEEEEGAANTMSEEEEAAAAAPGANAAAAAASKVTNEEDEEEEAEEEEGAAAVSGKDSSSQSSTLVATFPGSAPSSPPRTGPGIGMGGIVSPPGSQVPPTPDSASASAPPTEPRRRASRTGEGVAANLLDSDDSGTSLGGGFHFGPRPDWL
jgi:hypothetical protein